MISTTRPLRQHAVSSIDQVLSIITQNGPFDANLAASIVNNTPSNVVDTVSEVLQSIPKFFFQSTPSISIDQQKTFRRHRKPKQKSNKIPCQVSHRDPNKVELGLKKAFDFFYWVETQLGFIHNEKTCREMACLLARGNKLNSLWNFLEEMSRRESKELVTTATITCLIKVLAEEEGLVDEALSAFARMKQFNCTPDVCVYNTIIYVLCKHAMKTDCRKAIRRRLSDVNYLFRMMIHKGFIPNVVTYNSVIDCCCKTLRIEWAVELFDDMKKRGCHPNWFTYNSLIRYYTRFNEIDKAIEMLREMQKDGGFESAGTMIYTPIIHGLCKVGRLFDARNFLIELVDGGCVPKEDTFMLVSDLLYKVGEPDLLDDEIRQRIKDGIKNKSIKRS
ncbi:pentatricopeptide repeat-containing protein At1g77405-like [Impatiens glandulifera]|uniref:pentatricopeptide repeat-containing protein At1g77405-like n=1 Tax=Impatiens glandulifera TaxID=253017 RepID=UPI001FB07A7F|nr:pentatricopeptide repeat-containing protein At1g77405-like [Impatiens glandulifera]